MYKYASVAAGCLLLFEIVASANVGVSELVDKYRETQDKLQQSFITKLEATSTFSYKIGPKKNSGQKHELIELRFDGVRNATRHTRWGDVKINMTAFRRDEALYKSYLWDGEYYTSYLRASSKYPDSVIRQKRFRDGHFALRCRDKELNGFFAYDKQRVDSIISKAHKISVRGEMETVGEAGCYVIDAITNRGKYSLWIDPEHGFNIARAMVWKKEHHLFPKKPPSKNYVSLDVLENVRFERKEGIWIPVEADVKRNRKSPNGDINNEEVHVKRTLVELDPDHEALGSFLPDDIPNGAKVRVNASRVPYLWLDGKHVLDSDRSRSRK